MKTLLAILITASTLGVNKPSIIPSKITELKTINWYSDKAEEWETYITTNQSDKEAWLQYFIATEYAGKDVEQIQRQITERFSNTFLDHYTKFRVAGWTDVGMKSFQSAMSLDNKNAFTFEDQLIHAEITGAKNRIEFSKKLFHAGLIHSSTLNYSYNLLMSVSQEGLLITDGIHSTVPILVLQDVMNVRRDVSILNLELARNQSSYFDRILNEKNLSGTLDELLSEEQNQNIYYALTLPRQQLEKLENHLYVVGLASTTGPHNFNHFEILRENIEEKFLLDYLTIDFNGEPKTATGKVFSTNYIVPLLLLKEFYDKLENSERSMSLKGQIIDLAKDSQIKTRVELLLSQKETPKSFKIIELDVKTLDKRMKQIKGPLYASEVELTNRNYLEYMEYLRKNGYNELYEQSLPNLSKYDDITKAWLGNYAYSPENVRALDVKKRGGDYLDYPALDLTYESAKSYCEWLTVQYNAQEKREFKKVIFRLPSKEEWTMAALGYKDFQSWELKENRIMARLKGPKSSTEQFDLSKHEFRYPWGIDYWERRNTISNEHDCYLANVDIGEIITCKAGMKGDGFSLTSPVGTYFPNKMGLYDVIGNVAEMIDEPGVAMGGSWNHSPEESTILSENSYEGHDISVGFRLFMEVIEE